MDVGRICDRRGRGQLVDSQPPDVFLLFTSFDTPLVSLFRAIETFPRVPERLTRASQKEEKKEAPTADCLGVCLDNPT